MAKAPFFRIWVTHRWRKPASFSFVSKSRIPASFSIRGRTFSAICSMTELSSLAMEAPLRAIAQNAGFEGSVVVEKVKSLKKGEGLNCATGEYGNLISMGVSDPVKVTRTALESAASVAALILITEATINEIPKDPDPAAAAAAAAAQMGGGMM